MNLKENLLVTISEECAEISQAVSKALRFGCSTENKCDIMIEFYQLCAMIEMCQEENVLPDWSIDKQDEIKSEKKKKVLYFQDMSRTLGALKEEFE